MGGEHDPQSMISNRPRCSKTVMLRPISLMPPSAVTRRPPGREDLAGEVFVHLRLTCRLPQHRSRAHVGGQFVRLLRVAGI
ncbi:beta-lactamase -containing domain protein [Mycobacterium xenopi 3993]|nr:beta-lactamase -containing domain protein [Mycobacterium xenopi 3993]